MYRYDEFDQQLVNERVAQFRGQVARRITGELSEDAFKPLRLMNGLYLQQLRLTHREVVLAKAFQLLQAFLFKNRCEILFLTPLKGTAEWQLKCLLNTISVNWLVLIKTTHDYCTVQLSCAHT